MEQHEAGHGSLDDGRRVPSLWSDGGGTLPLIKELGELASLPVDFQLVGPVTVGCDNKAALSLIKDRTEGQPVKHIDIIHHFARDNVASSRLCTASLKTM
jgi:hypothetical protein